MEFSNSNTSSVVVSVTVLTVTHMIIFLNISFGQSGCRLALPPVCFSACHFVFVYVCLLCLCQFASVAVFFSFYQLVPVSSSLLACLSA